MKIAKIFILLIFFTATLHASGQEVSDFTEQHYTSDNGLPQNSVMQLGMDKNGFVWMTTQGGVVRFDGTHFVTYNLSNVPQLVSNRIIELGLTGDSTIYFKDTSFKVFSFDQNNQPFVLNPHIRNRSVVLRSRNDQFDVIRNLAPADRLQVESLFAVFATGSVYHQIGALGDGFLRVGDVYIVYLKNKRVVFSKTFETAVMSFDKAGILNNRVYFVNKNGQIAGIDSTGREFAVQARIPGGGAPDLRARSQFFQQGERLFLYNSNTFYELEPSGGVPSGGDPSGGDPSGGDPSGGDPSGGDPSGGDPSGGDPSGGGPSGGGPSDGNVLLCKPVLKTRDIGAVLCYMNIPDSGIQMVGTGTGGMYVFKKNQFKTVRIPGTTNNFYSQHLYRKNGLLTELGAILPNGTISGDPFPLIPRSGILFDREGYFWLNKAYKTVEKRTTDMKLVRKFHADREIAKIAQTPDGKIWLNTFSGALGNISGDSIRWLNLPKQIKTFTPVSNTKFWAADGKGIFLMDVQKASFQEIQEMKDREVRVFYFDKKKTLWAGTYGQGYYAVRNGKASALPLDRNGYLLVVHTFLEDKKGYMWMTTNHGLFKCRTQDLYDYLDGKTKSVFYYYYDKSNGFGNNEFNGGCDPTSVVLPDGKFSFPSMDGLVQVYPDSVTDILPNARILIDQFIVDGKEKPFSGNLQLEPSFNRIEIKLASPYFGLPENQLLEYNIKGLDDEWYQLNDNLTITLNRLGHGNYSLQVRKKAGFGSDNIGVLTKNFTVNPFWYQTWYATVFAICLLAFSFYLVVKLRYHYLTQRKKQLEDQVHERTKQLEYSNRLKEKITLLLAHDLQSPLHFLNLLSDHVAMALEKDRIDDARTGTSEIKKAATNIHAFVKEINLWTKSQQEGFFLSKRPFLFDGLADELAQFFKEMLLLKSNTLEFVNPGRWEILTNREILKAVVRNLIDNSNKYTTGGHIRVELDTLDEKYLRLSVTDSGRGMPPAELSKINRRIENVLTTEGIEQSGRLGYQIIIDFVARLDCKLEVTSTVGQGTSVTIYGILPSQPNTTEPVLADTAPPNFTTL